MPDQPAISVLLPTWNALRFLPAAIESILQQQFEDFEFVIVDDGSTDETREYLRSLRDPRVLILTNETNTGVTAALNHGLDACRGRYVARMDADDIAEPDRLGSQFQFLEANNDIGIVGSSRLLIDEAGNHLKVAPAMPDDLSIRWKCLLGNPLPHPTVMIRRDVLQRHHLRYDPDFRSAQDYELWTRLLPLTRAANIARPLLRYRIHASSISRSRRSEQLANHDRIAKLANQRLLPTFSLNADHIRELRSRFGGESVRDTDLIQFDPQWISVLHNMLDAFGAQYATAPAIANCVAQQRAWIDRFHRLPIEKACFANTRGT